MNAKKVLPNCTHFFLRNCILSYKIVRAPLFSKRILFQIGIYVFFRPYILKCTRSTQSFPWNASITILNCWKRKTLRIKKQKDVYITAKWQKPMCCIQPFFPWICSARACVPVCECVREFSFLSIVSLFFIRPNHLRVFFLHFTLFFFFCRISSLPHTPPHTRFTENDCYNECTVQLFRLSTHYLSSPFHSFFLLCTNQSASECMCLCVRAVSLFSILFSWLYCLSFVLFRFFSLSLLVSSSCIWTMWILYHLAVEW